MAYRTPGRSSVITSTIEKSRLTLLSILHSVGTTGVFQLATDSGLVGLGEISDLDCYRMHLPDLAALQVAIETVTLGRDPMDQARFHQDLYGLRRECDYLAQPLQTTANGIDAIRSELVNRGAKPRHSLQIILLHKKLIFS